MTANKDSPVKLQEEFTGVVARAVVEPSRDIEGLLGRMSEAGLAV